MGSAHHRAETTGWPSLIPDSRTISPILQIGRNGGGVVCVRVSMGGGQALVGQRTDWCGLVAHDQRMHRLVAIDDREWWSPAIAWTDLDP